MKPWALCLIMLLAVTCVAADAPLLHRTSHTSFEELPAGLATEVHVGRSVLYGGRVIRSSQAYYGWQGYLITSPAAGIVPYDNSVRFQAKELPLQCPRLRPPATVQFYYNWGGIETVPIPQNWNTYDRTNLDRITIQPGRGVLIDDLATGP